MMACWLDLIVTASQRVSLGQGGTRAFLTTSHPVIPGSVMRGALAAAWAAQGNQRDEDFKQVFERARFSPVIPDGVTVIGQSEQKMKYPQPETPQSEIRIDEAFTQRLTPADAQAKGYERCAGGYLGGRFITQTTTALTPRKNTAATGQLFSRQAIEAGTKFRGHIVLPNAAPTATLLRLDTVFVGGRSSVMGKCAVQLTVASEPNIPRNDNAEVVLRTCSPTILVDAFGAPTTDFTAALESYGLAVEDTWARRLDTFSAGGWHIASGLPKPQEISLAPGATAKVRVPKPADLLAAIAGGIGVRRNEGYGWLTAITEKERSASLNECEQPVASRQSSSYSATSERSAIGMSWADKVDALRLSYDQRQWLAGLIRATQPGDEFTREQQNQPMARRLSKPQSEGIEQIIRDVPKDQRNSLAFQITRGSRS